MGQTTEIFLPRVRRFLAGEGGGFPRLRGRSSVFFEISAIAILLGVVFASGLAFAPVVFPHGQESYVLTPDEATMLAENSRTLPTHRRTAQLRAFQHADRVVKMLEANCSVEGQIGEEARELLKKLKR